MLPNKKNNTAKIDLIKSMGFIVPNNNIADVYLPNIDFKFDFSATNSEIKDIIYTSLHQYGSSMKKNGENEFIKKYQELFKLTSEK